MNEECVVAVFDDLEHAQDAVHILDRGEFPIERVSLITRGLKEQPEIVHDIEMGDDSARDAAFGAGLGAMVGLLSGIAVMAVSGVGALFFAGPMSMGLTGGAVGGLYGGMVGWGVHEARIQHYEELLRKGKVLVIAHGDALELAHADRILKETAPVELHVYAKTSSEAPEVEA